MNNPRILIAAPASGSGKTMVTCGLLRALQRRGLVPASFKCGPDYIDPMFHTKVLGTHSRNLDTFFTDEEMTKYLFLKNSEGADISVMEGVMGYYDGLGGVSVTASAYDLSRATRTPSVLLVDARGSSVSILAVIKGFLTYREDSLIKGVILNRMSGMLYPRIRKLIEEELGIKVYGYVEKLTDFTLESRHLGLVMPDEVADLGSKLDYLAVQLEKTLDIDGLIELAGSAVPISSHIEKNWMGKRDGTRIGVARDEAFCFMYEDNLELLKELGAELAEFSPLHDERLPEGISGLILYGGYPELFAGKLSANTAMRESIRDAAAAGMPCMAECGGFMYLHDKMEDMEGNEYPMAGVVRGKAYRTDKLGRFGYIELSPMNSQMLGMDVGTIKAHEFHYFDSTACGDAFLAKKPLQDRSWRCIQGGSSLIAGFPHLYYYSNPEAAGRFVEACRCYKKDKEAGGIKG